MNTRTIARTGRGIIVWLAAASIFAGVLAAQTGTGSQGGQAAAAADAAAALPQSRGWLEAAPLVIKTVGGIGLVISVILVGFMAFRRFAPQYGVKRPADRVLKLIETLSMGDKRSLVLVQAGARQLLLACVPGQVTLLAPLEQGAPGAGIEAAHTGAADRSAAAPTGFRAMYEVEKQATAARPGARPVLSPDIRGKMQELRKALER
jgi:flagellar biogenesis protein FliO